MIRSRSQLDLPLGDMPARPANPLIGLHVRLDRAVDRQHGCHDNIATVHEGRGPHAAQLLCIECRRHRGWLAKTTTSFLTETVRLFGVPDEPPTIGDATATATAQGADPMATRNELFPSKYLKAADLKGNPVVVTIDKVVQETLEANGKKEMKPVLHFRGTAKTMVMNVTNFTSIADQHGDETDDWPGCKIELYPDVTDMKGKQVDCIRVGKPKAEKEASKPPRDNMDDLIPF